jgi:hypothetical protein
MVVGRGGRMREGQIFEEQIEAIRQRLDELIRRPDGRSARQKAAAVTAWEELSAALEDVGAIGEELLGSGGRASALSTTV